METAHSQGRRGMTKPSRPLETSQRNTVNCAVSSPNGAALSWMAMTTPSPDATATAIVRESHVSCFIFVSPCVLELPTAEVSSVETYPSESVPQGSQPPNGGGLI